MEMSQTYQVIKSCEYAAVEMTNLYHHLENDQFKNYLQQAKKQIDDAINILKSNQDLECLRFLSFLQNKKEFLLSIESIKGELGAFDHEFRNQMK